MTEEPPKYTLEEVARGNAPLQGDYRISNIKRWRVVAMEGRRILQKPPQLQENERRSR